MDRLRAELEQRKSQGLYRQRRVIQSPQGTLTRIDGRELLSFCSNDYLALANHPQIKQAFIDATRQFGVGSGSAHLVNGHSQLHHDCEQRLAEFTGRDRGLLFSTGYMANLAITSALVSRQDFIFQDKLNHASLIDAAQLSNARFLRYPHNDLQKLRIDLNKAQQEKSACRRLIMTDGVFSMDGDCAALSEMAVLADETDSWLMVDDAHGFGVLGTDGAGMCQQQGLDQNQVPILMATLGKAVGVSGAFIAGSEELIEALIQKARSYIFTTASPPAQAAAVMQSLDIIQQEPWRREKVQELVAHFKRQAQQLDIELMPSDTAIQPVVIGDNYRTLEISQQLFDKGFHVVAIRPPTVPEGTARLRVTLSAGHEFMDIDLLLAALRELL
jgi:8-amino-7-oxononanoate synthase